MSASRACSTACTSARKRTKSDESPAAIDRIGKRSAAPPPPRVERGQTAEHERQRVRFRDRLIPRGLAGLCL